MKPFFPTKMKIGFRKYTIRKPSEKENKKRTYLGLIVAEFNEIRLRDDVGDDELKVTLFHEYFHAAMGDQGMNTNLPAYREEQWCQFLSSCVMELVRDPDNWKIMQWAHEESKGASSPEDARHGDCYEEKPK